MRIGSQVPNLFSKPKSVHAKRQYNFESSSPILPQAQKSLFYIHIIFFISFQPNFVSEILVPMALHALLETATVTHAHALKDGWVKTAKRNRVSENDKK